MSTLVAVVIAIVVWEYYEMGLEWHPSLKWGNQSTSDQWSFRIGPLEIYRY